MVKENKFIPKYITPQEAAVLLNVSKKQIYNYINKGTIERYKNPLNGRILLLEQDIIESFNPVLDKIK